MPSLPGAASGRTGARPQPPPASSRPRVGYTGGDVPNATYRNHGTHAEGIEITFDPAVTSYRDLLEFYFQIHDPTTKNRQGNDVGLSYRSAIYYTSDEQRSRRDDRRCRSVRPVAGKGGHRGGTGKTFWEAEPEHQDYLQHYPNGYTCATT